MPGPALEITQAGRSQRVQKLFLKLSVEKVMTVHEEVSWLWSILRNAGKKLSDLCDTHLCDVMSLSVCSRRFLGDVAGDERLG
jgi:hypothetical protein